MDSLTPYLNFNGNAGEAMRFYHAVLGGELNMQTFKEAKMAKTPEEEDRIVHATLKGENVALMASDGPMDKTVSFGDNVHISLSGDDLQKFTAIFDGLSKGGKVDMPMAKQFWGDTFGMCTDKFGVHWMVNVAGKPS